MLHWILKNQWPLGRFEYLRSHLSWWSCGIEDYRRAFQDRSCRAGDRECHEGSDSRTKTKLTETSKDYAAWNERRRLMGQAKDSGRGSSKNKEFNETRISQGGLRRSRIHWDIFF